MGLTAEDVRARRFAVTKFREGYQQAEVDAFLERVAAALAPGSGRRERLGADDVVRVRFNPTTFRAGYDQDEVDDLLDEVVATLRDRGAASDVVPKGYVRADVDRLLARAADAVEVVAAVRSSVGVLSAGSLLAARLPRSTGDGYDPAQVDDLLEGTLLTLAHHERAGG